MSDLKKLCVKFWGKTTSLYEIFDIEKVATDSQIKSAYRKLSLNTHPDSTRIPEDAKETAKEKFQVVCKIYALLMDPDRRKEYDENGYMGEDPDVGDWMRYWSNIFVDVTMEEINRYEEKYVGSEEEIEDIKKAYIRCKGDLTGILSWVPFSGMEGEERIYEIIRGLIKKGELEELDAFVNESEAKREKRRKWYEKEAKAVEKMAKKANKGKEMDSGSLEALILQRQKDRMSSLASNLEEKYCGGQKRKRNQRN